MYETSKKKETDILFQVWKEEKKLCDCSYMYFKKPPKNAMLYWALKKVSLWYVELFHAFI